MSAETTETNGAGWAAEWLRARGIDPVIVNGHRAADDAHGAIEIGARLAGALELDDPLSSIFTARIFERN